MNKPIIVALSGSSGAIYGIKLLQILKKLEIETHLIISNAAKLTISTETDLKLQEVYDLGTYSYQISAIGSKIASGSFLTRGMIIAPCSMRSLSAIANGNEDNLIIRVANVIIKEQRKLVLMPREAPLSPIVLENMLKLSRIGVVINPCMTVFYNKPKSIDDMITYSVARTLDLFDIELRDIARWNGMN